MRITNKLPWPLIKQTCDLVDFDPILVGAIIATESAGEQYATRYEPDYRWLYEVPKYAKLARTTSMTEKIHQQTSWGYMQIMGALCRELGFDNPMPLACNAETNIRLGIKHLKNLEKRYIDFPDIVAAYNAGSPRKNEDGVFENQGYVDKVFGYYNELVNG